MSALTAKLHLHGPVGLGLWTGGADFLRGLTRLQFLNISRSLLTPQQLDALAPLTALQHLNLSETYLNDEAAKQVVRLLNHMPEECSNASAAHCSHQGKPFQTCSLEGVLPA